MPVGHTANLAVPPILNEGTAILSPHAILSRIISDNMHTICCGVPNQYTTLANHPCAKSSLKFFKNNLNKWTRCYCIVCKEYTLVIKIPTYSSTCIRCTNKLDQGERISYFSQANEMDPYPNDSYPHHLPVLSDVEERMIS